MPDMLVKLYALPPEQPDALREAGVELKRVMTPNYGKVFRFIEANFSEGWAYEACSAISRVPGGLYIAVRPRDDGKRSGDILGFAAYDATARGFFGPTGVLPEERASRNFSGGHHLEAGRRAGRGREHPAHAPSRADNAKCCR